MSDDQWTVRRILDWTIQFLKERESPTPRLDAEVLLAHARNCRRIQLYTQFDQPLSDEQRSVMRGLVKRRAAAEPVAYLVGHREFFSIDFLVRPGVLIPRPDTEILVMAALDVLKPVPHPRVLDLCTGSGCIPVAIAQNHPGAVLSAVELHEIPLSVAQENVSRHGLGERIQILQGDLFRPVPAGALFDVITSNPPYVTHREIQELAADVRDHEPHAALDGGQDGLDVIRQIVEQSPAFLNTGGWLMFELSPEQSTAAFELLQQRGFQDVAIKNDLAGQARVAIGRWNQ
jgi:release factor glutamine methyltransferase